MNFTSLVYERPAAVAVVTINDPPYNRMTFAFMTELESLVDDIAADPSVRSVVITAAGDENFSVGMNLKELAPVLGDRERVDQILDQRLRVLVRHREHGRSPGSQRYSGTAWAGTGAAAGMPLPACRAGQGPTSGYPELHLGSVPAWGGSRLVRAIGRDHAMNLILRAKTVSGPQALDLGLVTDVCPNTERPGSGRRTRRTPAAAMAAMLGCLVNSDDRTLDESLRDERAAFHATLGSPDMVEE